jgi:IS5 family transposase
LVQVIDFKVFRDDLGAALSRSDGVKGGRPPYDAILMFKVLVLQTLYTLSDEQTEYQLKDRLSFMRFVGLALHDPVLDAKTIWLYRNQLRTAGCGSRNIYREKMSGVRNHRRELLKMFATLARGDGDAD